jgi:ABC-2 type transport system ATP-binding protein
MIQVEHLTKQYGNRIAIQDLSFEVAKGEVLGFLGPNGAGKTTTMRILTGFMPATSGTARMAGYDVWESPQEVKKRIGYLPEHPPLYNDMTVAEYLWFVAKIRGVHRREIPNAIQQVCEQCSLVEVRTRLIGNLSKGYRQRVGLAQALIHKPEVLILDEPTIGLDPKQIIEVRQLIKGLQGGHTVILSTHILPEVTAVCQRVVIIHEGRVVAVDSHEGLSAKLRKSEKISLKIKSPSPDCIEKLRAIPGVLNVFQEQGISQDGHPYVVESQLGHDVREDLARCVVTHHWGLLEMRPIAMTLEDVFLRLTAEEEEVKA